MSNLGQDLHKKYKWYWLNLSYIFKFVSFSLNSHKKINNILKIALLFTVNSKKKLPGRFSNIDFKRRIEGFKRRLNKI